MREEVKYLGCILSSNADPNKEITKRIANCMTVFNKLHLFWRHSDCSVPLKLQVYDTIIRSKLMHGSESAVFNESHARKLDTFQLKGLRKILKSLRPTLIGILQMSWCTLKLTNIIDNGQ